MLNKSIGDHLISGTRTHHIPFLVKCQKTRAKVPPKSPTETLLNLFIIIHHLILDVFQERVYGQHVLFQSVQWVVHSRVRLCHSRGQTGEYILKKNLIEHMLVSHIIF